MVTPLCYTFVMKTSNITRILNIFFFVAGIYAIISIFIPPHAEGTFWVALKYSSREYRDYPELITRAKIELAFICCGAIFLLITTILLLLKKKLLYSIPIFFFFIASTIKLSQYSYAITYPYIFAADYILITITIILIGIDIYRIITYFKTRAPRPHRPRKPTSKERIAELEARVKELENR